MQPKIIFINSAGKKLESNLNPVDVEEIMRRLLNNDLLSGGRYTDLCIYNPELFIQIEKQGENHRLEFCLDCGQSKHYVDEKLSQNTDFFKSQDFIFNLVSNYFIEFSADAYKSA